MIKYEIRDLDKMNKLYPRWINSLTLKVIIKGYQLKQVIIIILYRFFFCLSFFNAIQIPKNSNVKSHKL